MAVVTRGSKNKSKRRPQKSVQKELRRSNRIRGVRRNGIEGDAQPAGGILTRAQTRLIRARQATAAARQAAQAVQQEPVVNGHEGAPAVNEQEELIVGIELLLQQMANLPPAEQQHIIVQAMQHVGFEHVWNGHPVAQGVEEQMGAPDAPQGPPIQMQDPPVQMQDPEAQVQDPAVQMQVPPLEQHGPNLQQDPAFQHDPNIPQLNINVPQEQVPHAAPNMVAAGPNIQPMLPPGYFLAPPAQVAGMLHQGQQPGVMFEPNADEQAVLAMQHGHQGPMLLEGAHLMGLPVGPNGEAQVNDDAHQMAMIMQEINAEINGANAGGGQAQPVGALGNNGLGGQVGNGAGVNGQPGLGPHVHPVNNGGHEGGIQNGDGIENNVNDLMATPPQHQHNNNHGGHAYPPTPQGPNRPLRLLEEKLVRLRVLTAIEEQKTLQQGNKRNQADHKQAETILVGQTEFYHWRMSYHALLAWLRYQHLFALFHVHIEHNAYAFDQQGGGAPAGNGGGGGGGGVQGGPGIPAPAGNGGGGGVAQGAEGVGGEAGNGAGGAQAANGQHDGGGADEEVPAPNVYPFPEEGLNAEPEA